MDECIQQYQNNRQQELVELAEQIWNRYNPAEAETLVEDLVARMASESAGAEMNAIVEDHSTAHHVHKYEKE